MKGRGGRGGGGGGDRGAGQGGGLSGLGGRDFVVDNDPRRSSIPCNHHSQQSQADTNLTNEKQNNDTQNKWEKKIQNSEVKRIGENPLSDHACEDNTTNNN